MSAKLIDAFFSAVNTGDMDAVRNLFHSDIVGVDNATGKVSNGIDENMADVNEWRGNFSNMRVEAVKHYEFGSTVVTEMKFEGTNDSDMHMPDGTSIPATGKTVVMQGCQVVEFADGKMLNTRQYYDMLGMMAQLGLLPS